MPARAPTRDGTFARSRGAYTARRRAATLERQRAAKRDALAVARAVARVATRRDGATRDARGARDDDDDDDDDDDARDGRGATDAARDDDARDARDDEDARDDARDDADVVAQPEWMWDDAPDDFRERWYARARPRGTRCVVVATRGRTTARSARDGTTLRTFQSGLPGGSARTSRGRSGECFCILDCVFAEDERARNETGGRGKEAATANARGAYHVLDVMAWNGAAMYDCDAEFRFFWAHTRLTEECDACEAPNAALGRDFAFVPTPWYECDVDGVSRAYAGDIGTEIDGLLFYHKEAAYENGATPLVLAWRDAKTSAFFTRDEGAATVLSRAGVVLPGDPTAAQIITLTKSSDGRFFVTGDDEPMVIAAVDAVPRASEKVAAPATLEPGRSGRFLVGPSGFDVDVETAHVRSADLHYLGPKPPKRRGVDRADALSKILFNARARTAPLGIDALLSAAAADAPMTDHAR
jgi:snurportin-1